eukprot:1419909-Prymnesium_polylepis.3
MAAERSHARKAATIRSVLAAVPLYRPCPSLPHTSLPLIPSLQLSSEQRLWSTILSPSMITAIPCKWRQMLVCWHVWLRGTPLDMGWRPPSSPPILVRVCCQSGPYDRVESADLRRNPLPQSGAVAKDTTNVARSQAPDEEEDHPSKRSLERDGARRVNDKGCGQRRRRGNAHRDGACRGRHRPRGVGWRGREPRRGAAANRCGRVQAGAGGCGQ